MVRYGHAVNPRSLSDRNDVYDTRSHKHTQGDVIVYRAGAVHKDVTLFSRCAVAASSGRQGKQKLEVNLW